MTFNHAVNLGTNAVVLSGVSGGVNCTLSTPDDGVTYVVTFIGNGSDGDSLPDGHYTLHVNHAAVTNTTDTQTLAADANYGLFRLFGDVDGDRGVSINDFNALAASFGTIAGNIAFNKAFDYDNDNSISINDFNQFSTRFGQRL